MLAGFLREGLMFGHVPYKIFLILPENGDVRSERINFFFTIVSLFNSPAVDRTSLRFGPL